MSDQQGRYNEIFEKLVPDDDDLVGMIAYALYKQSKRAWLLRFVMEEGRPPTSEETFQTYVRSQGSMELGRLRTQAESLLLEYSGVVLDNERPAIRAQALETAHVDEARRLNEQVERNTRWYKAILTGVISAFVYSLLLIAAVLVFTWAGVDILGVLEKARLPASHG